MAPLKPIEQTVFEEGPKSSVGVGAVTPFVYEETVPILPAPINPGLAVTDQQAWYKLGAEAFAVAGKLYEEVLDYQISGQEANIQAKTFDAEAEIDAKYSELQEKIAEVQLKGQSLDPNVYTDYQNTVVKIKEKFQSDAKKILGEDSYAYYTQNNDPEFLKNVGIKYRRLALQTKKSNYDLENSISQNFIASANSIRSTNNSYGVNTEANQALEYYHRTGTPITKSQQEKLIRNLDTSQPLDPDTTSKGNEQREELKGWVSSNISKSGGGKILDPLVHIIRNGLSENSSERQTFVALQGLTLASPQQIQQTFPELAEQQRYMILKSAMEFTPVDTVRQFIKVKNLSQLLTTFGEYRKHKDAKRSTYSPQPLDQSFADIKSISDLFMESLEKRFKNEKELKVPYLDPLKTFDKTSIENSPTFQAQVALTYAMTTGITDATQKEKMLSALADNFSSNPGIQFYEGGLIYSKINLSIGTTIQDKLARYNIKNPTEQITQTELAARTILGMPISLNSLGTRPIVIAESLDRELNFERTAIPIQDLADIINGIRQPEQNSYGKIESHGASDADSVKGSFVAADEVLRFVMKHTLNQDRLPTDKQITFVDNNGVSRTTTEKEYAFYKGWHMMPSADMWGIQVNPHPTGEFYITFTNIPITITKNNKTTVINLLDEKTIVPAEMMFPLGLTLYNPAGQTPFLPLSPAQEPDQVTLENVYMDAYLESIMNKTSTSPKKLTSYVDIDAEDPKSAISNYFKNTERLITPSNELGPVFQPVAPKTIDSLPSTDVYKEPLRDLIQYLKDKGLPLLNRIVEKEDGSLTPLTSLSQVMATLNSPESQIMLAEYLSSSTTLSMTQAEKIIKDIFLLEFPPPTSVGKPVTIEELIYFRNVGKPYGYVYLDFINAVNSYLNPSSSLSLESRTLDLQNNPRYFSQNPGMEEAMSLGIGPRQPVQIKKPFTLLFDSTQEPQKNPLFGVGTNNTPGLLYDGNTNTAAEFMNTSNPTAVNYVELENQDDINAEELVDYDLQSNAFRTNGERKGNGWLGPQKTPNGKFTVTEYSVGVSFDINPMVKFNGIIPTLVPGLSKKQIDSVLLAAQLGTQVPDDVMEIAIEHARKKLQQGKSVFKEENKKPQTDKLQFRKTTADATVDWRNIKFKYVMSTSLLKTYERIYGPELAKELIEKAKQAQASESSVPLEESLVKQNAILPSYTDEQLNKEVPVYENEDGTLDKGTYGLYRPKEKRILLNKGILNNRKEVELHESIHATQGYEEKYEIPEDTILLTGLNDKFMDILANRISVRETFLYMTSPHEFPAFVAEYKALYYKDTGKILTDIGGKDGKKQLESFKTWLKNHEEKLAKTDTPDIPYSINPFIIYQILESPKSPAFDLFRQLIKQVVFVDKQDKNTRYA